MFLLTVSEVICRSVDSKVLPAISNTVNPSNISIENHVLSSTGSTSTAFDICESFETHKESKRLQLRDHRVTVVMKLFWQLWSRQVVLLSKLEARFHNAGHTNVQFIIVTRNETNAERIRNISRQLEVIIVNTTETSQFAQLEDRSAYIFDNCGRIVYIIHYPYSSVQKPFVKAAILSTIYDQPCGYCASTVSQNISHNIAMKLIEIIFLDLEW